MLNYSNTHRRDPNVKKYALKCALTLAAIVALVFVLYNYGESIWHGISTIITVICSGVSTGFVATADFLKPVFSSVGQYIVWAGLLVSLWALCVYFKIDENCEASKMQWRLFGVSANAFLFLYTILYMIYLNNNDDPLSKYGQLYGLLWFYLVVSGMCFLIEHKDKSNQ
jgi:hypothetical protein